jgi:zinc/manganese transport system permease protein
LTSLLTAPIGLVGQLVSYPFMVNALLAGSIVAVLAGVVGWFMVLRQETFAGHTLAVITYPGAAAATLAGVAPIAGYFAGGLIGALTLGVATGARHPDSSYESASIGVLQAGALALGFVLVTLSHGLVYDLDALLFGTFLGVTTGQVVTLAVVAAVTLTIVAVSVRPLLFASVDAAGAAASGVRVRLVATGFLVVLAAAAAATSQITGALLVFALLVTPAATAQRVTARPAASLLLSVLISLAVTWLGLAAAYFSVYPVGFYVTSLSFAAYLATRLATALRTRTRPLAVDD